VRRLGIEVKTDIREQLQAEAEAEAEYVYIIVVSIQNIHR
jgi:hypothetical protein